MKLVYSYLCFLCFALGFCLVLTFLSLYPAYASDPTHPTPECGEFISGSVTFVDERIGPEEIHISFVIGVNKGDPPEGKAELLDHNTKKALKSINVLWYHCGATPTCRSAGGQGTFTDPTSGTRETVDWGLYACDNDPNGRDDRIEIFLSNGYSATSSEPNDLNNLDRGDIVIKPKDENCKPCGVAAAPPLELKLKGSITPKGKLASSWANIKSRYSRSR